MRLLASSVMCMFLAVTLMNKEHQSLLWDEIWEFSKLHCDVIVTEIIVFDIICHVAFDFVSELML